MTDLSAALEILEWGAARTDGMSASLTPAQCTAVLNRLQEVERNLVDAFDALDEVSAEGFPV